MSGTWSHHRFSIRTKRKQIALSDGQWALPNCKLQFAKYVTIHIHIHIRVSEQESI